MGGGGQAGPRRPASTSSTCTGRTPTCPRSSSPPSTTGAPTSTAARSRTARGSGWRRSSWSRRRSATTCAIAVRIAADTLDLSERADRGRARVHPRRRPPGRPVGRRHRLDVGAGPARLRAVAVLRPGLPAGVVGPRPRGDRQADRRGRPVHRPRPDGRPRARRHRRPDRRRAAVHLRPVPAGQDRGGPLRRGARVHRLQRLLLAVDLGQPPGLHAERDGRRGAPPRLASGAVRAGRQPRPGRADRRRRAGRDGVRDGARQARHGAGAHGRRRRRHRRLHALGHADARARVVGPRDRLPAGAARPAGQRVGRALVAG